jgi:probable phosphoglycerate mutase
MLLRFDGASKGNPGKGGSAAVLFNDNTIVDVCYYYHPTPVTNNVAEYVSLIIGLKMALALGHTNIFIEGDSKLVIEQVFGKWKCNHPNIVPLCDQVKDLKKRFTSIHGRWIPREENGDADKYANIAVEKKHNHGRDEWFIPTKITAKQQLSIFEAFAAAQ